MDLVLLVDFLLPVTLKDRGKSTSPTPHLRGAPVSATELREEEQSQGEAQGWEECCPRQERGLLAGGCVTSPLLPTVSHLENGLLAFLASQGYFSAKRRLRRETNKKQQKPILLG